MGIVPIYIPETEQYDVILRCTIQYALLVQVDRTLDLVRKCKEAKGSERKGLCPRTDILWKKTYRGTTIGGGAVRGG